MGTIQEVWLQSQSQVASLEIYREVIQETEMVSARDVQQEVVRGMWNRMRNSLHAARLDVLENPPGVESGSCRPNEMLRKCAAQNHLENKQEVTRDWFRPRFPVINR